MTATIARPVLVDSGYGRMSGGGTVSYAVELDGRLIGWVFDERAWKGSRWGRRTWSSVWRENGDKGIRWRSDAVRTRTAALEALAARVRG